VAGHERVDYCGIHPDLEGRVHFTTHRGDRLTLHYVGMRVDPATFVCQVVATRGTGRFAGTTVDALLWIEGYSPSRPFDFTFDGTIEYP
jgi:hypothetical protein